MEDYIPLSRYDIEKQLEELFDKVEQLEKKVKKLEEKI